MNIPTILIVDDEKLIRWSVGDHLNRHGFRSVQAGSMADALAMVQSEAPDLVLLDQMLPDGSGIDVILKLREIGMEIPVIMLTAIDKSETAVRAMKLGAYDYLTKPVNLDELLIVIGKTLEATHMKRMLDHLLKDEEREYGFSNIVGASPGMQKVFRDLSKIAQSSTTTVLVTGESGTGKELIARAIHTLSDRKDRMFVAVNCSALTETLIESELFGHEKGAYTDARSMKKGLFELADNGTVLLDEIGDMSPSMQAKLLRILESRTLRRVGGTVDIPVDVRIVAATNQPLETMIKDGKFRTDLFYRLNVARIHLPPLRERGNDVLLLADHFMREFNQKFRKHFKGLSPETRQLFITYHWPGNVREIRNVVERAVLLDDGDYIFSHDVQLGHIHELPGTGAPVQPPPNGHGAANGNANGNGAASLAQIEKQYIVQALEQSNYNQSQAAKLLKISRDALRYKMKKFKLLQSGE